MQGLCCSERTETQEPPAFERKKCMFQRILVPLDGSPLAEQALPVAARVARATGGTVVLLHVAHLHVEYGPYLVQTPYFSELALKEEQAKVNSCAAMAIPA